MHSVDGQVSAFWFFTVITNGKRSQPMTRYVTEDYGEQSFAIDVLRLGGMYSYLFLRD
jgi:hypothetical protein